MSKPDITTYGGMQRDVGYAGQVAKLGPATIESRVSTSLAAIEFGRAVARGSRDQSVTRPAADADEIIGISVRTGTKQADASGNVAYNTNDGVPVMRLGYIYAIATEATNDGDYVVSLTAGAGTLGSKTGGASGAGRVLVPNAKWETTVAAGQVGLIRIGA